MPKVLCLECDGNKYCDYLMPDGNWRRLACDCCHGHGTVEISEEDLVVLEVAIGSGQEVLDG